MGGWFTTKEKSGGGGLIDIGVHLLDLTMWLMKKPEPVSVSASTYMKFGHKKIMFMFQCGVNLFLGEHLM